ncbi:MAG: hypothetical protein EOM87_00580 [Clostridia bacterium]|nr:hypothetical protein [Clostridia bacterium]
MKEFFKRLKAFSKNELVCAVAMLVALMYGMFYLDIKNPLQFSLSEIGRYNYPLFLVWSITSGLAIFLNVNRLYDRIGFKSKQGNWLLYSGMFFLVLTFCNMSKDPIIFYWIHVATAILFAVLSFGSIALGLIHMFNKNIRYKILTIIFFSLVFIDIILLAIFKQMALYEFIPLMLGYVVMFFTNFTESFKVNLPN